jgi:hypothetical protein
MKTFGCALAVLGLTAIVGSIVLFGFTIDRAMAAREAKVVPLTLGEWADTGLFEVDTTRLCQVVIALDARSHSVHEDDHGGFDPLFDFPVEYKVLDADGKVLSEQAYAAAWNTGTRSYSDCHVTASGGTFKVECSYEKFKVPPPGRIRVEVRAKPDTVYKATAKRVELKVYDNVSAHGRSVLGGCVLIPLGGVLILSGVIVFIVGLFRRAPAKRKRR